MGSLVEKLRNERKAGRALLAANFYNAETLRGVLEAAKQANAPVILQTSPSTLEYLGSVELAVAMARAVAKTLGVEAYLHLDHATDEKLVYRCIDAGYESVMIDASEKDVEYNTRVTREVVGVAHKKGVTVEAELGYVPKLGQADATTDHYTTPEAAQKFVDATGVDLLAVSIGSAHGFYKKEPRLDLERLSQIRAVTDAPLVLHGGSGMSPQLWQDCIKRGIAKINFATEIKDLFVRTVQPAMASGEIDLRKLFAPGVKAVTKLVKEKIEICQMTRA